MKTNLRAAIAVIALLASPALAADLPIKAPNKYLAYPTGCGFFYGVNSMGAAGGVTTNSISGANQVAGDVGVTLGYGCPLKAGPITFWFVDGMFDVSKLNGAAASSGFTLAGRSTFEQRFAVGAPWSTVQAFASMLPGLGGTAVPNIPSLPLGVTAGPLSPYMFVAAHEQDVSASLGVQNGKAWLLSWGAGIGALHRLSNGMVLDTWVEFQAASSGVAIGVTGQSAKLGDSVRVGVALKL